MKIVTHSGSFHQDELFAVAALKMIYPDAEIIRTRDPKIIVSGDIVVDIGGISDPEKNRFDHHQDGGAGKRHNGMPYASFGLVWKKFGRQICGGRADIARACLRRARRGPPSRVASPRTARGPRPSRSRDATGRSATRRTRCSGPSG